MKRNIYDMNDKRLQRRRFLKNIGLFGLGGATAVGPLSKIAYANRLIFPDPDMAKEISWDDLIPADVPYPEIIGEGEIDLEADTWNPIFDENARKFNESLRDEFIKLPGFVVPLETGAKGITSFILVPYYGACIHVPPPPPNQLVMVSTDVPWRDASFYGAVWVSGNLMIETTSTEIAETGYKINADFIEEYEWD